MSDYLFVNSTWIRKDLFDKIEPYYGGQYIMKLTNGEYWLINEQDAQLILNMKKDPA